MAEVMFGEQEAAIPVKFGRRRPQLFRELPFLKEPVFEPDRHCCAERPEPARGKRQISLDQPLEFEQRLIVEGNKVDICETDFPFREAIGDCVGGVSVVVFLAGKALLLGRGDYAAVFNQGGRAVVIKGRNAENAH